MGPAAALLAISEVGWAIQGVNWLKSKIDPTNVYQEEITVEVWGNSDQETTKMALWQMALSIAFGKVAPFGQLKIQSQPVTIFVEYDVFGRRVKCYLAYEYSDFLAAPYFASSAKLFQFTGKGKNVDPVAQRNFLQELSQSTSSGLERIIAGPGPIEDIYGGGWPAWSRGYGNTPLPEEGHIIASNSPGENPAPIFDTGSRGDWLGVAIAAQMQALANKMQLPPVNLNYIPAVVPQPIPVAAIQPLVNYPAIDQQALQNVVNLPGTADPKQVNNSDYLGIQ